MQFLVMRMSPAAFFGRCCGASVGSFVVLIAFAVVLGGCSDDPDLEVWSPYRSSEFLYTSVSGGLLHTCSIHEDAAARHQNALCWGDNAEGQSDEPPGRFAAVAAGWWHTCAIRDDQTLACWGDNEAYQASAPAGLRPVQAVYAVPSGIEPVEGRERAIAHVVSEVQRWFRTQTGGKHPLFARNGRAISVLTVRLPPPADGSDRTIREYADETAEELGAAPDIPLFVYLEGPTADQDVCGQANDNQYPIFAMIPIANCSDGTEIGDKWPSGSTYLAAHELAHLLGAVPACAPNSDGTGHVTGDNRDLLYQGPDGRNWSELVLDVGQDDYYKHRRDDCADIAYSPLLVEERFTYMR